MKVLQINCVYKLGSTGKIMYDIHTCLLKNGYESVVVYGRGEKVRETDVYKSSTEIEGKIHSVFSRLFGVDFGYSPIATAKLFHIIKKEKPDVVHLQCLNGHFVNVYRLLHFLKKHKIKTVLSLHAEIMHTAGCQHAVTCEKWKTGCSDCSRIKGHVSRFFRDDAKHCYKLMKKACNDFENLTVVGVSEWITERAKQSPIFETARFETVINGIETDVFTPRGTVVARAKLSLPQDKKIILHVTPNVHDKEKGVHYVIELAKRMSDHLFVVVGGTPKIRPLPSNMVFVPITYNQKTLADYYSAADCFVMTSSRETCPTVCLEAVACGCTVVGFDTGGVKETIPDGMGEVVAPFDIDALENAARRWADIQAPKAIIKQLHTALSRDTMTNQYIDIYTDVLSNNCVGNREGEQWPMKVLWIVNMVFPAVAKKLGLATSTSGGWLLDLAKSVSVQPGFELGVMTYYSGKEPIDIEHEGVRYFLLPGGSKRLLYRNPKTCEDCKKIVSLFNPDLIHIHGTEYAPGREMLEAHPELPTLLTIQGVIRRISQEYYGGFSLWEILKMSKVKDVIRGKIPLTYKLLYQHNAKREEEVLNKVKYVTGRTDWDKSVMLSVNPSLQYYRCNYNLRDAFYSASEWNLDKAEKHCILTGAAHYSLKGLHILIKALSIVKQKYPDVKLLVPGGGKAEKGRLVRPSSYTRYIEKMIAELELQDNVVFIGNISAEQVAEQLGKSHICVVPSAIEGASATLCEAMYIGTPSICAHRGGMIDLLTDGECGFTYDFPEYPLLAHRIMQLFEDDSLCQVFSEREKERAFKRHNRETNTKRMIEVYEEVLKREQKTIYGN